MTEVQASMQHSCAIGQSSLSCMELLSQQELELLQSKIAEVNYKKGEIICKQGAPASQIMLVRDGLVKIYMENNSGENLILQIMPGMNIIGLSTLFEGNTVYQFSAQAYLDTKLDVIDSATFRQLIRTNPDFATKVIALLAEYNTIISGRFFCLTQKQTYGRFADVLLCLANRIYKSQKFPLHLSRKELAEIAGMSVESVARIITRFKEENLIDLECKHLNILDYNRMFEISQKG
ncbi:MAG: Crp/Fnr family transcriptional regulator [Lentimicrobium sp.]|nr:Crp/Fnr family transcriptional regulator [Lentimicrobium sp.]